MGFENQENPLIRTDDTLSILLYFTNSINCLLSSHLKLLDSERWMPVYCFVKDVRSVGPRRTLQLSDTTLRWPICHFFYHSFQVVNGLSDLIKNVLYYTVQCTQDVLCFLPYTFRLASGVLAFTNLHFGDKCKCTNGNFSFARINTH